MERFDYVGRHPVCGHMRAAVADEPGEEKFTAESVSEFIASGMRIERVSIEEVRAHFGEKCDICEPPKAPKVPTLFESAARSRCEPPK